MMQEINLYQSMLRPREVRLPASRMLVVALLLLAALAAAYAWTWARVDPLATRVAEAFSQVTAGEAALVELRRQHPERKPTPAIVQKLAARRAVLAQTRQIAEKLRAGAYGSIDGLSPYLEGLARQYREGAWLTRVRVQAGGSAVGLTGRALLPELVPAYIARLAEEPAFAGKTFSDLELEAIDDALGEIGFSVRTRGLKQEDDS
jgi:MSHA biogenesis protein MshI